MRKICNIYMLLKTSARVRWRVCFHELYCGIDDHFTLQSVLYDVIYVGTTIFCVNRNNAHAPYTTDECIKFL